MAKIEPIIQQKIDKKEYKKLKIYNERMVSVLDFIVSNNINGIDSDAEFLLTINYPNKDNLLKIRKGQQGFTQEHMLAAHIVYGVDMNYIYNKEHKEMFIQDKRIVSPFHRLLEVVHMIGLEINK